MPRYKLEILIKGTDQASGAFRSAGSSLKRMGEIAGGIIGAQIITRLAGALRDAAGAALSFGKEAVMSAARVQEMDAVIQTLAKNQGIAMEAVDKTTEAIKAEGITTQVAQNVMTQFIRYNMDFAKASQLAAVAQDAAVISMQDSSTALDGLMQGIIKMNVRVLRTYGITLTSVVGAQDKYAKSLGKTRAELTTTEKINSVLNEVLVQGEAIQGAYTAAMNTAGKQMRSMSRHVTELKNNIGKPLLGAFSTIIMKATEWLKILRGLSKEGEPLNRMMKAIARIMEAVLGKAIDSTGGAVETLTAFINRLADWFEKLANIVENVEDKFAILLALGVPKWLVKILKIIGELWRGFKRFVGVIAGWVFDVMPAMYAVVRRIWPKIKEVITNAVNAIRSFIGRWWPIVQETFNTVVKRIKDFVLLWWPVIRDAVLGAVMAIKNWIDTNWPGIKDTILNAWNAVKDWVDQHWPVIKEKIITAWEGVKTWADTNWPIIKETILHNLGKVKTWIEEDWPGIWERMQEDAKTTWDVINWEAEAFVSALEGPLDRLKESLAGLFDEETLGNLKKIFGGLGIVLGGIVQGLLAILAGLLAGIIDFFASIVRTIGLVIDDIGLIIDGIGEVLKGNTEGWKMIWDGIKQWFIDSFLGLFESLAAAFSGFISGILNFWKTLDEKSGFAISEAIQGILGNVKGALGIESPSKEMAKIGQSMMAGLTEGLQGSVLAPVQAMGAMAPAVMGAVGGSSTYSRDTENNYNLTINSRAQAEDVRASFGMMKALGGGGT